MTGHPHPALALVGLLLAQGAPGLDLAGGAPSSSDLGPGIAIGLLIAAIGAGAFYGASLWRSKRATQGAPAPETPPRASPASSGVRRAALDHQERATIEEAIASGEYAKAGDLLARSGRHAEAGDQFAAAHDFLRAARAFAQAGKSARAIHFFKQAGEYAQAARLYAARGDARAAAAEYVRAGDLEAAAAQYAAAGDDQRAGRAHEKRGAPIEAAEAYARAGDHERAGALYERALPDDSGDRKELDDRARSIARRAGDALSEAGDHERAARAYARGAWWEEAAGALRSSGDLERAAQMLLRAERPLLAAAALEEAGQGGEAARMRAEQAEGRGDLASAAEQWRAAGDSERAASLYERDGQLERAASIFEELGALERAAPIYARALMPGHAARCFEQVGQLSKAAEQYEAAADVDGFLRVAERQGDYLRAARVMYDHRRLDEALAVLAKVDSRDPLYVRALELGGDVLRAQNRPERAYSRYRAAVGKRDCDESSASLYYKMGLSLEAIEDESGAMQNYQQVLQIDPGFADVADRVRILREQQRRGVRVSSSGIFSANDLDEHAQRYEIIDEIARGGMGVVYKARDTVLSRVVALKKLGENLRDNEMAVKYFLREARAAAALSHPNIVLIYDAGEQDGEAYMAMEFIEGTTLKELIRRAGALPNAQVRYILVNACRALHYAHSKGVIHRDIKSGNVMITREKTIKIMDFGLAKFLHEYQNDHTQQVGTPFYMSPEQIVGKNIDFRSDLYSLGCMMFECATGTVPFFKGDLSYHHIHTPPPSPRSINLTLSRPLEEIILRLLEKDPDKRFQSAGEIEEALP